ncbi:MAG: hypothetical protein IKK06_02005 [Clostridia bacterium]|nr:hypothetical protein [Clostridia bacterium]
MKKLFALLLALTMLAALSVTAMADFTYEGLFTDYDVLTPAEIAFSYVGETSATAFPRGGGTLECLIDGEHLASPTTHTDKGIVLVCNDFIKPDYEVDMAMAYQNPEAIPTFSFALTYAEEVTFDSVYLSLFYMAKDCVCAPGEHKVVVETSEDGELWVPVGEDGSFYFRDNQPIYSGVNDPYSEEIVVPLGEEVTAQYVRLSFKFKELDAADDYWDYYTNVYEWCGFTELGVAQYAGGDNVPPMTQEEAAAPDVVLEGLWTLEAEEGVISVVDFSTSGVMKMMNFEAEDFEVNGVLGTALTTVEYPYVAEADYIVADQDGEKLVLFVTFGEGTLELDDGEEPLVFDAYVPEEPEVSEEESSEEPEESSEEPEESSEDESSEPEESSEEESVEAPATSAPATSSEEPAEDGGDSTMLIVIIAVVAVVIIGVVVVILIKRKK